MEARGELRREARRDSPERDEARERLERVSRERDTWFLREGERATQEREREARARRRRDEGCAPYIGAREERAREPSDKLSLGTIVYI